MTSISKKEIKIISLLLLDSVFFFLEIIVGYAVNSLALIADSFHMLNDIISLLVALWAVNVAKNREADSKFTYGWQRAEILGALVNAVFLLALCFSIFIEAIQRFIVPAEITNAKLILIVGTTGLVSNIVGLLLFHEHDHSHGGAGGHSHGSILQDEESTAGDTHHSHEHGHSHSHYHDEEPTRVPSPAKKRSLIHRDPLDNSDLDDVMPDVIVNQLSPTDSNESDKNYLSNPDFRLIHGTHNHILKKDLEKGSSKSLNMQGVFLHVMGDALGNIGVMATALFIWKTDYSWRFYTDPLVSLVITVIIFSSALPLCKSSSRILLQGTPQSVDFDDVKDDILKIPGVLSVHDFHIWNLTERVLIASLHVDLSISPEQFLQIASTIKGCLHEYGIHSATIQPEFSAYYAQNQILPKRYSHQQLAGNGTTNSSKDNLLLNSTNNTSPIDESEGLLNSSSLNGNNSSATTYGTSDNAQGGDIHCIVDAATGCTAADCVH